MKLVFAGTRGEVERRTKLHRRHTCLVVSYRRRRVLVDCGADWLGRIGELAPHAIVLTHAHPDHAWGLAEGAPCPVHATEDTWRDLAHYPVEDRRVTPPRAPRDVEGISFEAFPVEHSTRCPTVAYRIRAGRRTVLYAPDLVYVHDRADAFADLDLYAGDGATMERPMVRRRGDRLIGHAPVRTQLAWCAKAGVPRAVITHCGSGIVAGHAAAKRRLRELAAERGVRADLAYDGMEVVLR